MVFPYPEDRSKDFVKRLIGFGGEKLEIRNKQVFIDGKPIEEPYKQHDDPKVLPQGDRMPRDNLGPITVPEGSVFVMETIEITATTAVFGDRSLSGIWRQRHCTYIGPKT